MKKNIAVMGAGSWGTALAVTLGRNGHRVRLWDINETHLNDIKTFRENRPFLPGVMLPDGVDVTEDRKRMLEEADLVLFAVPSQHFRQALTRSVSDLPKEAIIVNVAKGIEQKSLQRMSEIAFSIQSDLRYVVLSGPSHAEEVGRGMPTTVAVASPKREWAEEVQDIFMNDYLRIYTNDDVAGVELGGSLKNIIALGAGISDGLGYGDNAKAAMMTRGITEITRLGVRLGADPRTFSGLSGIGDLIVTCTSMHSRNRRCGIMIGEGMSPAEAVEKVGMVVEGMYTADAAYRLAKKVDVEMPITEAIYQVIHGDLPAKDAVSRLMSRSRKHENEDSLLQLG
ncbi:MAG: NAD(P)H-dependent glycerol-3-phosphate dehydrogenase [Eubacteriales bacterium]|jgi:glycerol-3-phosphate dehydrogenase (NAD(P)+)|nr:NAD(P)H-dependent glycerol-3-phosphate dehydrogenase [Eubacteriales bacterium]MDD4285417.1 NAD(P)H-dependent glycerol-3-phosphate dehydrogenase [Eubacteriales bacterium]NLV70444.1 NAD(P)H-dependent glycerol-3-phosphate dehydrogenase [Clostridiales bacterium]